VHVATAVPRRLDIAIGAIGRWFKTSLGINAAIVACSLTLIAVIWTIVIVQLQSEREETIAGAIKQNSNLVRAFEEHTTRTVKGVDAVTRFLVYEYARLGAKTDIAKLIENGVIDSTLFTLVVIIDERGAVVTSSYPLQSVSLADREYFQVHVHEDSRKLFIGKPIVGRTSGKMAFQMTRRINKADGSFGGVVSVGVDPAYFSNFYRQSDLGDAGVAQLVGLDNIARARRAGTTTSAGQDMSTSTLMSEQRKNPLGSFLSSGKFDGMPRYSSYRTLSDYPLVVAVGTSQKEVLTDFLQSRQQDYLIGLLASAIISVFAFLLMRALAQQRRTVTRLMGSESQLRATFDQTALERSLLRAVVDAIPERIYVKDRKGRFLLQNSTNLKVRGVSSPQEVQGKTVFDILPREAAEHAQAEDEAIMTSGESMLNREGQAVIGRTDVACNQTRWYLSSKVPLKDEAGNVYGLVGVHRDISDRMLAETALRQLNDELEEKIEVRTSDLQRARLEAEDANYAKSSFLAAMSHEIRTPMNGVIGMIDVLHQSSLRGDQVEMVDLIRESAFSLLGIINDILDFSKIEAGKLELEREAFAVGDVVESVCGMLNNMAEKKDVVLTLYTDPTIPAQVLGDALRLRQILINLANNAIKFCSGQPSIGRVSVRALLIEQSPEKVTVEFRITDNGIGMDEETQARLFNAFTQADATTTRHFGGTGLGLTIANNLVGLMGGEITVQSAPGEGSTFTVHLPFGPLLAEANPIEDAAEVDGLSCLVVGAADGLSDDLSVYLKHANALVERAPDLASARKQAAGRSGLSVWVVDASNEPQLPDQLRIVARAQANQDIRFVVVLIERGSRRHPRVLAPDMITVDGNVLSRRTFLRAVAAAAGRASLEVETEKRTVGKLASVAPSRIEALRQGKLILIAEDNETNQKVIVRQLALLGYAADVAADGREALGRWHSGEYALLLTDLHMPVMDGYELTQAIRAEEKEGKRIPVIALTANAIKGEAERCRAAGMDDYRSKPSPLAELKAVLDRWLSVAPSGPHVSPSTAGLPVTPQRVANAVSVDVSVLEGLVGDDPELIRKLLQDFRDSAAKITLELRAACAASQTTVVVAAAHKLRSAALAVGALALGALCAAMEEEAKAGDSDAIGVLLPRFETEMTAVEQYLEARWRQH